MNTQCELLANRHTTQLNHSLLTTNPATTRQVNSWISITDEFKIPNYTAAAIFDVNGTIAKSEQAYREALRRAAEDLYQISIPLPLWQQVKTSWNWSSIMTARLVLRALSRILPAETTSQYVCPQQLVQRQEEIFTKQLADLPFEAVPETLQLIERMQNIQLRLGFASGSPRRDIEATFRHLGFDNLIRNSNFVVDLPSELRKPHPYSYQQALRQCNCDPSYDACIAFEDTVRGALSALRAGLTVLLCVNSTEQPWAVQQLLFAERRYGPAPTTQPFARIVVVSKWGQVSLWE